MQNIMGLSLDQTSKRNITLFQLEKTLKKLKRCLSKFYGSKDMESGLINLSVGFLFMGCWVHSYNELSNVLC